MKVSIIIPTYNRSNKLYETLKSLGKQEEIIVVDDCSTDGTKEMILNYFHDNIRYYKTDKNSGPAIARNLGIKKAKGDIILFTDDDCLVPTNWVERYKKIFKENDVGVVGGYLIPKESNIFYAIDKIKDKILGVGYLGNKEIISRNIKVGFTNNCGYRKDVLMKVGFFNENFRVPAGEDTELNDRVAKHYNAMYIPISVIHNNKYNYQYLTNMVWKQVIEKMPPKNALSSTLGLIILSPWVLFKVIKKVIQYRK